MSFKQTVLLLIIIYLAGFGLFSAHVNEGLNTDPDAVEESDGIVVLTGGQNRIVAAIDLLNRNVGNRLLITGVHKDSKDASNFTSAPQLQTLIDLDDTAVNTEGNATSTKQWMQRQRYTQAVIVTSHYHMPRALIHFHRIMPGYTFPVLAVKPDNFKTDDWWKSPENLVLLLRSYNKFLATLPLTLIPPNTL